MPIGPLAILVVATLAPLVFALVMLVHRHHPTTLFQAFIVVCFLSLNSALSLLNRWALGVHGFRFPLAMTALHMLFGSFALSPLMLLRPQYSDAHREIVGQHGRTLSLIGALNALQIAANNASLQSIELSLNQVIRAFGPVIVAVLAAGIEGKRTSAPQAAALVAVSVGVVCTVFKSTDGSVGGMLLVLLSITMQSLILSLSGRLMGSTKLDGFQMAFYMGPVGFLTLAPFAGRTEAGTFLHALSSEPAACLGFLLGSSMMAVGYNVVVFQSSKTLSSVGTAVLANLKIVLLLTLSAVLLGEMSAWSARQVVGVLLTFGGTMAYSYCKHMRL